MRADSSVGRTLRSQRRSRGFESRSVQSVPEIYLERYKMVKKHISKVLLLFVFLFGISFIMDSSSLVWSAGIKRADLAGLWYPAESSALKEMLLSYIDKAGAPKIDGHISVLIVPHAGYLYSGRTAGYGFKVIKGREYSTVVIIGFTHRKFYSGISVYSKGVFETPLGRVHIDEVLAKKIIEHNNIIDFYPPLFKDENSVEMIIPLVQVALPDAKIVPIAIGLQRWENCSILADAIVNTIKNRKDVLVIASTDMSHYHPYKDAVRIDNSTLKIITAMDIDGLVRGIQDGKNELCGAATVMTAMLIAKRLGASNVKVLKYENSGDVTGDKTRVVGYMSVVFYHTKGVPDPNTDPLEKGGENNMLTDKQKRRLLEIARKTIEEYITTGNIPEFEESDPGLLRQQGAFVTLHKNGQLRGCIGNIIGRGPLYKTVRDMAIASSTEDWRFSKVRPSELDDIEIEISVLSEPERVTDPNKIVMGKHGVIVKRGKRSGVFLPQVATETGWSREEFLSNLCAHKAGLEHDAWKDPRTELYVFTAEVFSEKEVAGK